MRLERLQLRGLRCITEATLDFSPGFNVLVGANGAGKTSVLEATFLLSHGRSFRSGARDALLQRGAPDLSIFSTVRHDDDRLVRLGLGREGARWGARMEGQDVPLGQLVRECAVVCFEPGSHALIAGAADERRRFLDWGVFHVEQDFLPTWRRYQRALKQRNSLLRTESLADESLHVPWEMELARCGTLIDQWRRSYLDALLPHLATRLLCYCLNLGRSNFGTAQAGRKARIWPRSWPDSGCGIKVAATPRLASIGRIGRFLSCRHPNVNISPAGRKSSLP